MQEENKIELTAGAERTAPEKSTSPAAAPGGDAQKTQRRSRILIYLLVLFVVAFALLLMSYFVSQRNNSLALGELSDTHARETATAFANIENLQNANELLTRENTDLRAENDALQSRSEADAAAIADLETRVAELETQLADRETRSAANERGTELLLRLGTALAVGDGEEAEAVLRAAEQDPEAVAALTDGQRAAWEDYLAAAAAPDGQ